MIIQISIGATIEILNGPFRIGNVFKPELEKTEFEKTKVFRSYFFKNSEI